jgi:hypothetical protein
MRGCFCENNGCGGKVAFGNNGLNKVMEPLEDTLQRKNESLKKASNKPNKPSLKNESSGL